MGLFLYGCCCEAALLTSSRQVTLTVIFGSPLWVALETVISFLSSCLRVSFLCTVKAEGHVPQSSIFEGYTFLLTLRPKGEGKLAVCLVLLFTFLPTSFSPSFLLLLSSPASLSSPLRLVPATPLYPLKPLHLRKWTKILSLPR